MNFPFKLHINTSLVCNLRVNEMTANIKRWDEALFFALLYINFPLSGPSILQQIMHKWLKSPTYLSSFIAISNGSVSPSSSTITGAHMLGGGKTIPKSLQQ